MRLLVPEVRDLTEADLPDLYDVPQLHLRAGLVASLDGAVAVDGSSKPLSGEADLAVLRALRTVADAVLVGAGTARAEGYTPLRHRPVAAAWRAAHGRPADALLVVVTRSGRLPEQLRRGPVLVVAPESADVPGGLDVLRAGRTEVDLAEAVAQLRARGLGRLHCEGGPALLRDLLAGGLVDELCLTQSPALVGQGPRLVDGLAAPLDVELVSLLWGAPGPLLARWRVVRSADGSP